MGLETRVAGCGRTHLPVDIREIMVKSDSAETETAGKQITQKGEDNV
jgi:hypothetical protein